MNADIVRYRPPRARVAVAFSTKDRTGLTRLSVAPLLDHPDIDLYWFDGSATEQGRQLPLELCPGSAAIRELHLGIVGGPDCAIMYTLRTLRERPYDFVTLIENDIVLFDGWYAAMREAIEHAEAAGFKVGGATARVWAQRVLSCNDDYCLMLNSGAGCIAFRPEAIDIVLAHYRTLDSPEFVRHVRSLTGIDVSGTMDFLPAQPLCVDFIFDLILYLHGYVVAAPATTFARTMDEEAYTVRPVNSPADHLPEVHGRITRPDQIRTVPLPFYRFQQSPASDRMLLGCHQLRMGVGSADDWVPVCATGAWRRIWQQGLGPFGMLGTGAISVAGCGETVGLLLRTGATRSRLWLSCSDGSRSQEFALEPHLLVDFPLWETGGTPAERRSLHVADGKVCFVGLTVNATALSEYANGQPTVAHLPL